jgi:hypothetical protein
MREAGLGAAAIVDDPLPGRAHMVLITALA